MRADNRRKLYEKHDLHMHITDMEHEGAGGMSREEAKAKIEANRLKKQGTKKLDPLDFYN